jgi:hypothetical protein
MLLPAIQNKNKRGLSIIIGYVLLMVVSIVMSVIVYQWLKTYVPKDALKCPDGTSLFIKDAVYDCTAKTLTLTFKNNGRFGIDGYFIHVSTDSNPDALATIDLSGNLTGSAQERENKIAGNSIRFSTTDNSFNQGDNSEANTFDVSKIAGTLSRVEIIPIRMQTTDKAKKTVSCSDAKVETALTCK